MRKYVSGISWSASLFGNGNLLCLWISDSAEFRTLSNAPTACNTSFLLKKYVGKYGSLSCPNVGGCWPGKGLYGAKNVRSDPGLMPQHGFVLTGYEKVASGGYGGDIVFCCSKVAFFVMMPPWWCPREKTWKASPWWTGGNLSIFFLTTSTRNMLQYM